MPQGSGLNEVDDTPRRKGPTVGVSAAVLVPAVLLAYATVWRVGFLSDDFDLLATPQAWGVGSTAFWRPLSALAIEAQLRLFGPSSVAFHAVSLAAHALIACAFVRLLSRLGVGGGAALAGGLAFAVAPLHSEVVYWMSAQNYLLEAACLMAGALLALRYAETRSAAAYGLALAAATGALFTRESGAMVPLMIAVLPFAAGRARLSAGAAARALPFLLLSSAAVWWHYGRLAQVATRGSYALAFGWHVPRNVVRFVLSCLYLTPLDDRALLGVFRRVVPRALITDPRLLEPHVVQAGPSLVFPLVLLGAVALAVVFARGGRAARAGLLLFGLAVVPYVFLRSPLGLEPSRFLYLPSVGLLVAVVAALARIPSSARRSLRPALAVALAVLAAQTCLRGRAYIQATGLAHQVVEALAEAPLQDGVPYAVAGVPDNVDEAYVFRNGLAAAVRRRTGRPALDLRPAPVARRLPAGPGALWLEPRTNGFRVAWESD